MLDSPDDGEHEDDGFGSVPKGPDSAQGGAVGGPTGGANNTPRQ